MEIKAKAKYIPISPEKVRSVANLICGKKVEDALAYLKFEPRSAKTPLMKVINSIVSNAENKKLDKDRLIIKEIRVDGGPIHKKQKIRARGRADLQKRRTSHITIVLADAGKPKSEILNSKQKKQKNLIKSQIKNIRNKTFKKLEN